MQVQIAVASATSAEKNGTLGWQEDEVGRIRQHARGVAVCAPLPRAIEVRTPVNL